MPLCLCGDRFDLLRFGVGGFQVADEALEGFLVGVVVFPVAEVGDEVFADLAGGIFAGVGVEALPVAQGFKGRQADGEKHPSLVAQLALAGLGDFRLHPLALHAVRRQDQQQLVVQADGFVDLLVDFLAALNVVRGKPTAYAFVLQVGVEAVGEGLVFGGVADEAGVELDGASDDRLCESDEFIRDAAAAEEYFRDLSLGAVDRVSPYGGRPEVVYGFESPDVVKVVVAKGRPANVGSGHIGIVEGRPSQVCPCQIRPS